MSADLLSRITIEPGKMSGKPCIRGLRMRVIDIKDRLEAGASRSEILDLYPYLELEDIDAALLYAIKSEHE